MCIIWWHVDYMSQQFLSLGLGCIVFGASVLLVQCFVCLFACQE